MMGSIIVLCGFFLMGDVMSYVVLLGVVLFFLFNILMFIGVFVIGMFVSLFIGFIILNSKIKLDVVIGISFIVFLVFGVIIISLINSIIDLYYILFGNLLVIIY